MMRFLKAAAAVAVVVLVAACSTASDPRVAALQNLTTTCDSIAATVRTLAVMRTQGKLSASQIAIIEQSEGPTVEVCSPDNPPVDLRTGLAKASVVAAQLTGIVMAQSAK